MNPEVIKEFLVGLGFGVDDQSLAKFNQAIQTATKRVVALYVSVQAMAAVVFYSISKISEGFEQMGYEYRIIAPAINKALVLRRELLKAYAAAGINLTHVIQQSIKFNMSLAKTKFAFEAIYRSVGVKFLPMLTKQMDVFRAKIYQNMPKIQAVLERMVKFILKAFEATVILGTRVWSILTRVYDFFVDLDKATNGWSTKIMAVVAAWQLLNLSFLATPLGMLITGLVALLALYDDFKTFQEGGQSALDWRKYMPAVKALTDIFHQLWQILDGIATAIAAIVAGLMDLGSGRWAAFIDRLKDAFGGLKEVIQSAFSALGDVGKIFSNLIGVGAEKAAQTWSNFQQGSVAPNLPSSVAHNSSTNINVRQQTAINVSGAADVGAVGRAVAGEQSRVNFDMTRNMKGATR